MNKKISDKDKQDWQEFLNSTDKLENKDQKSEQNKEKKDSKIEVDLNHLNLKNIIEEEIKYFFWVQLFLFSK